MVEVLISSKSGSVSSGDWAPAMAAAYDDIKATGGSIIMDAETELKSGTSFVFGVHTNHINIIGRGAPCKINAGASDNIFYFGNNGQVRIVNQPFHGDTGTSATADCGRLIYGAYVEKLMIDNCPVAGIVPTTALYEVNVAGEMLVENSKFGGNGGAHVLANGASGLAVRNCDFYDYQNYLGNYYDRQQANRVWIQAINGVQDTAASGASSLDIEGCRMDEGAGTSIYVSDFQRVNLKHTAINQGVATAGAMQFHNCENVNIFQHWAGYNPGLYPSMVLRNCRKAFVDSLQIHNGIKEIDIDALTDLTVVNSPEAVVTAAAGARYSLNGVKYRNGIMQIG